MMNPHMGRIRISIDLFKRGLFSMHVCHGDDHDKRVAPLANMAHLLHPATLQEASDACRGCRYVVYTSTSTQSARIPLEDPRDLSSPLGTCFVAFTEFALIGRVPDGWRTVHHRRTNVTLQMTARRFSKLPKLTPTAFVPRGAATLFKDTKIVLSPKGPRKLFSLLQNASTQFAAFVHPKLCTPTCNATALVWSAARNVAQTGRVDSADALFEQSREYAATTKPDDVWIDCAILVQRGAVALFALWAGEVFERQGASADRDQPAFAYAFSRVQTAAQLVPYDKEQCGRIGLCHWYHGDRSVGVLTRVDFGPSRVNPIADSTPTRVDLSHDLSPLPSPQIAGASNPAPNTAADGEHALRLWASMLARCSVVFHVHIPKTGGTSIARVLRNVSGFVDVGKQSYVHHAVDAWWAQPRLRLRIEKSIDRRAAARAVVTAETGIDDLSLRGYPWFNETCFFSVVRKPHVDSTLSMSIACSISRPHTI